MPTVLPAPDKAAFIALVNVRNPTEAVRLATVLVNYEDIPTAIGRQLDDFTKNLQYLKEAMACFTVNAALLAVGIYNSQPLVNTPVTDPVLWINSNATAGITITANSNGLGVIGASTINRITIAANKAIKNIYIGGGANVNIIDSTASGAFINNIYLVNANNNPGSLNAIKFGSSFGNVDVETGAYFGGVSNVDPTASCAIPVTAMLATEITHEEILISWTPPASGYLSIDVYFKKTNSKSWILVNQLSPLDGDYVDNTGFVFRNLDKDTLYDFKARVTCNNGGIAETEITALTVCCGTNGTRLSLYCNCVLVVSIITSPNTSLVDAACNGVLVQREYAPGTTLQILDNSGNHFLAGPNIFIMIPILVSGGIVDDLSFNTGTGTFDASGSTLSTFADGNTVKIPVSIPIL